MSTTAIHVEIERRSLLASLQRADGEIPLIECADGRRPITEVRCLGESIPQVLRRAAIHLDFRDGADIERPDLAGFAEALRAGAIRIHLYGDRRELAVIELIIQFELALTNTQLQGCVERHPQPAEVCIYDTLGADMALTSMEAYLHDQAEVDRVLAELGEAPSRQRRSEDDPVSRMLQTRTITLGLLGTTGAGKSTLLNALLGIPDLVPTSTDICTAVPVFVIHALHRDDEGFEVDFITEEEFQALIENRRNDARRMLDVLSNPGLEALVGDGAFAPFVSNASVCTGHLPAPRPIERSLPSKSVAIAARVGRFVSGEQDRLRPEVQLRQTELIDDLTELRQVALKWQLRPRGRTRNLRALSGFVARNQEGTPWHRVVNRVHVHLGRPILRHLRIVDAAGLMDPDPARVERTRRILSELNGWLLVHHGEQRALQEVERLLEWVRKHAHVPEGLLLLTRVDLLKQQDTQGLAFDTLLRERHTYYEQQNVEVRFACPMAAELGAKLVADDEGTRGEALEAWWARPWGRSLLRGWNPEPLVKIRSRQQNVLDEEIEDRFFVGPAEVRQAFADYQVEMSGIIGAVGAVTRQISQQVITQHVDVLRNELISDLDVSIQYYERKVQGLMALEEAANKRTVIAEQNRDLRAQIRAAEEQINHDSSSRASLTVKLGETRANAEVDVHHEHLSLIGMLGDKVKGQAREAQKDSLKGTFSVDIRPPYIDPLLRSCNEQMSSFVNAVIQMMVGQTRLAEQEVHSRVTDKTRSFTFEGNSKFDEKEKFFEWFDTTLERVANSANTKADSEFKIIKQAFSSRLLEIQNAGIGALDSLILTGERALSSLRRSLDEQSQLLEELVSETEGKPRGFFQQRLHEAQERLERLEVLRGRIASATQS